MNNQQAIDRLVEHLEWGWSEETVEAIEMGIHALKETKWIPCSEKMPEESVEIKEKKMEIKEAMEILEKDIHTEVPKAAISARKHDAAVRMALVALEKQIPVKPIILDELNGDIDYECPLCGKQVMSDAESRSNYCGECGCKFDWSEIEGKMEN